MSKVQKLFGTQCKQFRCAYQDAASTTGHNTTIAEYSEIHS